MPVQLLGLGADGLDQEIDGFLLKAPSPSSSQVADFLKLYGGNTRAEVARRLIARGVSATAVSSGLNWLDTADKWAPNKVWAVVSVASTAASAYHGYRRNNSIGWAIVWGLLGGVFPVITPAIALAQGFGKRKA